MSLACLPVIELDTDWRHTAHSSDCLFSICTTRSDIADPANTLNLILPTTFIPKYLFLVWHENQHTSFVRLHTQRARHFQSAHSIHPPSAFGWSRRITFRINHSTEKTGTKTHPSHHICAQLSQSASGHTRLFHHTPSLFVESSEGHLSTHP